MTDTVRLVRKFIFLVSPLIAAIYSRTELCACMNTYTDICVHACICSMCLHVHTRFMPVTVSLISDWFSDESMLKIVGPLSHRDLLSPSTDNWTTKILLSSSSETDILMPIHKHSQADHHEQGDVFGPIDLYDLGVGPGCIVFPLLLGEGLVHPVHSLRQLSRPA